ncbi:MAG: hypothetical protein ACREMN_03065, partial [Gemmatimonadales bacterium]
MLLLLLIGSVLAAFIGLWALLGSKAGLLWTPAALAVGAALALLGAVGAWIPWALDAMLLADAVLLLLVWIDGSVAARPGRGVTVRRDPLPALSVGHVGEVAYHWTNATRRRARLIVREIRPDLLGGIQAPRRLTLAPDGVTRDRVPVAAVRRGRVRGED